MIRQTRQLTDRPFGVNLILHLSQHERLKVCLEEGIRVVSFFWGDPSPYIAAVHAAGSLVMHTVGSVLRKPDECAMSASIFSWPRDGKRGVMCGARWRPCRWYPASWMRSLPHRWWQQEGSLMDGVSRQS